MLVEIRKQLGVKISSSGEVHSPRPKNLKSVLKTFAPFQIHLQYTSLLVLMYFLLGKLCH